MLNAGVPITPGSALLLRFPGKILPMLDGPVGLRHGEKGAFVVPVTSVSLVELLEYNLVEINYLDFQTPNPRSIDHDSRGMSL